MLSKRDIETCTSGLWGLVENRRNQQKPDDSRRSREILSLIKKLESTEETDPLNINRPVWVKLTDYGYTVQAQWADSVFKMCEGLVDRTFLAPKFTATGYCEFKLWELIEQVLSGIHMGDSMRIKDGMIHFEEPKE